jgi:ABC-2 type transport system permease protein
MASGRKKKNLYVLAVILFAIVAINLLASFLFFRIDLTAEKRHTLSSATKTLIANIDSPMRVTVFLKGDYPPGFIRLSKATREFLDVLCAYNYNISYEFINPNAVTDAAQRDTLVAQLIKKGLTPTSLNVNKDGKTEQQLIFPSALITYKNREVPVDLLKSQIGVPPEEVLNNSVQSLEFNLAVAFRKLTMDKRSAVAFLTGHREAELIKVADAVHSLREFYAVYKVKPDGDPQSLFFMKKDPKSGILKIEPRFKALIIAKPDSLFSEADKFLIDQYVMYGGKVLWYIDPVSASMDSIRSKGRTIAFPRDLNLEDQLFRYGVRLNNNLILDLNAAVIPVVTGQMGGQPQQSLLPWYFYPVLTPLQDHPIVKNLNAIKTEFVSSMDTIKTKGVQKTILLTTSKYSRIANVPMAISLDILREQPDQALFNKSPQAVAVLLEGQFTSLYRNRIPPTLKNGAPFIAMNQSRLTGMLVVSDGDAILNQVQTSDGQTFPLPLGYDRYSDQTYGNRDLLLNTINYLCDDAGLVSLRTREVKLRLLDKEKIKEQQFFIQAVNIIAPVLLIIVLIIIFSVIRKRKFSRRLG